jgi:AraC family transcriptional regulator
MGVQSEVCRKVERNARGAMEIEAALCAPSARVQVVHYHFFEPPDSRLHVEGQFRIELCLGRRHRSARGCFHDHWGLHRFERIGSLFVVPPDLNLLARSDEAHSLTSIVCELKAEPLLTLFDSPLPEPTEGHLLGSLDVRNVMTRDLLLRLAAEVRSPGFASEMLVELLAGQLAIELFRHGATISEPSVRGGLASWQLRTIDERLAEPSKAPTLAALAALCRISIRQLTRAFRTSRGCSIGAYVADSATEHAKRLLTRGDSVTSVSRTLGFATVSSFCLAFRRAIGMTPGEYRQRLPGQR